MDWLEQLFIDGELTLFEESISDDEEEDDTRWDSTDVKEAVEMTPTTDVAIVDEEVLQKSPKSLKSPRSLVKRV